MKELKKSKELKNGELKKAKEILKKNAALIESFGGKIGEGIDIQESKFVNQEIGLSIKGPELWVYHPTDDIQELHQAHRKSSKN